MYNPTAHACRRITERNISDDELAAALAGICLMFDGGNDIIHIDRKTRTMIKVRSNHILTVYRLKPKQLKRILSRRFFEWFAAEADSILFRRALSYRRRASDTQRFKWPGEVLAHD